MVAILSNQREAILESVRSMYTEVATSPETVFHFPTGRSACEFVGYPADVLDTLPVTALESFAGVGYPFAVGVLEPGDTVLDIGAGSGTDSLIAAGIVGATGTVYGLDMTKAMLAKLAANARAACAENVVALEGNAEEIPLPDDSVTVVTSNGVINLVPDKSRCIAEIHRVLRPGGYVQIADIVLGRPASDQCRLDPRLWAECVVGATLESRYLELFQQAGFGTGILGTMDYFAGSSSAETRSVAGSLHARSVVLWAAKPPLGAKVRRSVEWPRAASAEPVTALSEPSRPEPADVLEAYGVTCGCLEPLLKARIRGLESGQILEVRSDEPAARVGIPSWSRLTGHALVATIEGEEDTTLFYLQKK
jgi:arsenite methyltransferase